MSPESPKESAKLARTIAITSGKGGVGKTSVAVNLAISLAKLGSDVCLFDADTGLANINIMLGIHPQLSLANVINDGTPVQDISLEGPMGIHVIPGASGISECANLSKSQQKKLLKGLQYLERQHDYLLIDTAAGVQDSVLHFVQASDETLVVITPEPTSLTDAFSLIKLLKRRGYERNIHILVNQCRSQEQAREIFLRLAGAAKKYLGTNLAYLGFLRTDETLRSSIALQRPVALYPSSDPSSRCFLRLAENLELGINNKESHSFSEYWQQFSAIEAEDISSDNGDAIAALLPDDGQPNDFDAKAEQTDSTETALSKDQTSEQESLQNKLAERRKLDLGFGDTENETAKTDDNLQQAETEAYEIEEDEAFEDDTSTMRDTLVSQASKTTEKNAIQGATQTATVQNSALLTALRQRDRNQSLHDFLLTQASKP